MSNEMDEDDQLLEVAAQAGLDLPYSCTNGMCSTCRCHLAEGKAKPWRSQGGEATPRRGAARASRRRSTHTQPAPCPAPARARLGPTLSSATSPAHAPGAESCGATGTAARAGAPGSRGAAPCRRREHDSVAEPPPHRLWVMQQAHHGRPSGEGRGQKGPGAWQRTAAHSM